MEGRVSLPRDALPTRLNLGSGGDRRDGCLNVDRNPAASPDLVWDLDRYPYPLPAGHFDHIHALDVVEHLADIAAFMQEAHRLLREGGLLEITTPHFSCSNSYTDPAHRWHLGYYSFDYFTPQRRYDTGGSAQFSIETRVLAFRPGRFARLVSALANRWPAQYERRWAWIWPAWFLLVRLRAVRFDGP